MLIDSVSEPSVSVSAEEKLSGIAVFVVPVASGVTRLGASATACTVIVDLAGVVRCPVGHLIGNGVRAAIAGVRGIIQRAVRVDRYRAMQRRRRARDRERVAIDVAVIAEHIDVVERRVFAR